MTEVYGTLRLWGETTPSSYMVVPRSCPCGRSCKRVTATRDRVVFEGWDGSVCTWTKTPRPPQRDIWLHAHWSWIRRVAENPKLFR